MKIFKKIKKGYDREVYLFNINIFNYKSKTYYMPKHAVSNKTLLLDKIIEEFADSGINSEKKQDSPRLIVSLTSFPARMYDIHYCLYSILTQSHKPDEIILWLGEEKFPNKEKDLPEKVLNFRKNGLTIKWCKDIRSFTKLIPALKEYPNDIIITADDDLFYKSTWLEKLYTAYEKNPSMVHCHRVHRIRFDENTMPLPYNDWIWEGGKESIEPSFANFLTGCGGVLYPPHSFYRDILDEALFQKLAPSADDIFLWAMLVLNRVKINRVENYHELLHLEPEEETQGLAKLNVVEGHNDIQLKNVFNYYPELKTLLKEQD